MPAARPAPAGRHVPSGASSQHHANVQSSTQQPFKARKRAKQAAGAGTFLLALFSFVVFLGPLGPLVGPRLSGSTAALEHLGSASLDGHMRNGRVLMAVGSNSSGVLEPSLQHNETALQLPVDNSLFLGEAAVSTAEGSDESQVADNFSGEGRVVNPGSWGDVLEAPHVEPFKSVVLRPSNKKAEVKALQSLKVTLMPSSFTTVKCTAVVLISCFFLAGRSPCAAG